MDGHLVGYGSSSEDEKKARNKDIQKNSGVNERKFRKRSSSPDGIKDRSYELGKHRDTKEGSPKNTPSKSNKQPSERSPDRKQRSRVRRSRSRSRSSSGSTDKEPKSAVDEHDRHVRRQNDRNKDEDREKRRYSREQRRSRSRSRDRDRNRGYNRNDRRHNDRRDDRHRRYSDRGPDRSRNRSRDRSRSRDRERRFTTSLDRKPPEPKEKVTMSSEEIEKKLAARAESMKHVAQLNAANHNLPSYLNPSVVNPMLYAKQQERRKLLWSAKKTEETPSNNKMWAGTRFTDDKGGEVQAKFRRLMGIKGEGAPEEEEEDTPSGPSGEKILTDLEKEFERSRQFQLSRGAGGKSGIGLGYASAGTYPQ